MEVENVQQVQEFSGALTERKRFPAICTVLCLLALVGPLYVITVSLFYLVFDFLFSNSDTLMMVITIVWSIASIGTIIGSVMLMMKKMKGLYVYSISQAIYLIAAIYIMVTFLGSSEDYDAGIAVIILLVIPSLIFLGLFWMTKLRKYLS